MNRYELQVRDWRKCERCELCNRGRKRVVLCRGKLPADVVFVGEAPGPSEDVTGDPFDGPAGDKLDEIINSAGGGRRLAGYGPWRLAFTNLLACIPLAEDRKKWLEPSEWEYEWVTACKPRLEELLEIANPRLVVAVGSAARDWLTPYLKDSVAVPERAGIVHIMHPSAILRSNTANRSLHTQRCVVTLRDAFREYLTDGKTRPPRPKPEDIPF